MYWKHAFGPPDVIAAYDGVVFGRVSDAADAVYLVGEYHIDDIRPEDVVVDIGANVGAFCIRAARRSRHWQSNPSSTRLCARTSGRTAPTSR